MIYEHILSQIDKLKQTKSNKYRGCCPLHDDTDPSLDIEIRPDDIRFTCFGGCDWKALRKHFGVDNYKPDNKKFMPPQKQVTKNNNGVPKDKLIELWENSYTSVSLHKYVIDKKLPEGKLSCLRCIKPEKAREIIGYVPRQRGEDLRQSLLIAKFEYAGELRTVQFIDVNGAKCYTAGEKKGSYCLTEPVTDDVTGFLLGEGYATALSAAHCANKYNQEQYQSKKRLVGVAAGSNGEIKNVIPHLKADYPGIDITIITDNKKGSDEPEQVAVKAAQEHQLKYINPDFTSLKYRNGETDFNDMLIHTSELEVGRTIVGAAPEVAGRLAVLQKLKSMQLTKEDMAEFEDPAFIIENLVVKGHILTINAAPGGGKTSIIRHYCPPMVKAGYDVIYINSDISGPDAKKSFEHAQEHGYTLLLPTATKGDGERSGQQIVMDYIFQLTSFNERKSNTVFIFDTLKKFTNMMDKTTSTKFYTMQRELSSRGYTIINLAHTNKYRQDGLIVHEGTGDHVADVDDQLYFDAYKEDQVLTVTTREGTRARFAHYPMSFEVTDGGWGVKELDEVVDVNQLYKEAKESQEESEKEDNELMDVNVIKDYIKSLGEGPIQSMIVDYCRTYHGWNRKKTLRLLNKYCNLTENDTKKVWRRQKTVNENNGTVYRYYLL